MCENQIHDTVVTTHVKETPNTRFTFLQEPISWQSAKLNDAFYHWVNIDVDMDCNYNTQSHSRILGFLSTMRKKNFKMVLMIQIHVTFFWLL